MRVGLYARVSTYDQHTLPLQMQTMQEYVRARGWSVSHSVEEVGSGARRRPRRDALLKAAKRRELDVILVWRLDRWGRSLLDLIETLEEMSALGVGFISLTEALDLTTPTGRAMVGMLAVFAEFEREVLRDRVKAGIAQARKEGRSLGRPQTALQHSVEVCQLHSAGVSQAEIARRLQIGRTSVRRILAQSKIAVDQHRSGYRRTCSLEFEEQPLKKNDNEETGYGQGRFVLGYGPNGVFGHVDLVLKRRLLPGDLRVAWAVEETIPEEARGRIEEATRSYLDAYGAKHSILLCATITHVRLDPQRRNDYERAVNLAMYKALIDLSLPLPLIYTTSAKLT